LGGLEVDWAQIEEQGFTVVKGVVPKEVCRRAVRLMDDALGPPGRSCHGHIAATLGLLTESEARAKAEQTRDSQLIKWPDPLGIAAWDGASEATRPPEIASGSYRHSLRHPIRDAVMADLVPPAMVAIHRRLLRTENLRMNQQFMIRTDYNPAAAGGHHEDVGWHLDHSFLPQQYEATPRAVYYSSMVALKPILPGGAAFLVNPHSLREGKAAAASILADDPGWCAALTDDGYRTELSARIRPAMSDAPGLAHEILADEGDAVIINPSCLHSASDMTIPGHSRYVTFQTFIDADATFMLLPERGATRPAGKFPSELRAGLAAKVRNTPSWPRNRPTSILYSCVPTGMREPT
jgi:hypothetical protein